MINIVNEKTAENSPKRKRTRQTHSTQSSPATPEVPNKRRRWYSPATLTILMCKKYIFEEINVALVRTNDYVII